MLYTLKELIRLSTPFIMDLDEYLAQLLRITWPPSSRFHHLYPRVLVLAAHFFMCLNRQTQAIQCLEKILKFATVSHFASSGSVLIEALLVMKDIA